MVFYERVMYKDHLLGKHIIEDEDKVLKLDGDDNNEDSYVVITLESGVHRFVPVAKHPPQHVMLQSSTRERRQP